MALTLDLADVAKQLKSAAGELGFVLSGITPAATPPGYDALQAWLAAGYAGEMHYFAERLPAYRDLNLVLPGASSLLLLAMPYLPASDTPPPEGAGRVASYAWGVDYHQELWRRLDTLCELLRTLVPGCRCRGVTDSAPLLEREFAQLAGLGWIGKNTLLLNRDYGSWFFLAALVSDVPLPADQPFAADHCGTCTACLTACPTNAFVQPYVLDATRCISYLTIETRTALSETDRQRIGDWLWGCDICQMVCPWNNKVPSTTDPAWQPPAGGPAVELGELFYWTDEQFATRFRHTPLWRAKRRGLLRNAAIVLANQGETRAIPALTQGTADPDELVRAVSAWAIEKLQSKSLPGP
ncbi:MAG: tRNA epoxyqueuosine(34) reductase QueG [Pirellulales bacterium]|nr:tRNA epoxyqueuosine(34) reductase QueG [Pirellulales bacterium]